MALRGVLFDLDNTLAHRDLSIASYARRFVLDFGERLVDANAEAIAALVVERDNGGYGVPGSPFATVRHDIAAALATRLPWRTAASSDELVEHWFANFPNHSVEMPGAAAMLDRLVASGLAVGIVSNGMEASRRALARHLGFDRRIRTLVSSERAGARKPDARIFALAAQELDVPAAHCWFLGDHPVNDIDGARAAGMRPVWLAGFHEPPPADVDAPVVTSLAEFETLLRSSPD